MIMKNGMIVHVSSSFVLSFVGAAFTPFWRRYFHTK